MGDRVALCRHRCVMLYGKWDLVVEICVVVVCVVVAVVVVVV